MASLGQVLRVTWPPQTSMQLAGTVSVGCHFFDKMAIGKYNNPTESNPTRPLMPKDFSVFGDKTAI